MVLPAAAARSEANKTVPKRPRCLIDAFNGADAPVSGATAAVHGSPHDATHDALTGPRGPRGRISGSRCGCAQAEGRKPRGPRDSELRRPRGRAFGRSRCSRSVALRAAVAPAALTTHRRLSAQAQDSQRHAAPLSRLAACPQRAERAVSPRAAGMLRAEQARRYFYGDPHAARSGRRSAARATRGTVRAVAGSSPRARKALPARHFSGDQHGPRGRRPAAELEIARGSESACTHPR